MSEDARYAIIPFPEFITEPRGIISVKVGNYCISNIAFSLHILCVLEESIYYYFYPDSKDTGLE